MVQVLESAALDPYLPLISTVALVEVLPGGSVPPSVKWGNSLKHVQLCED